MADADSYFETEAVVKEYDSKITARILSYLKPYSVLAILALGALVFSTLGELAVPVLQQRLIDRAIMARFLPLKLKDQSTLGSEGRQTLKELVLVQGVLEAGEYLFVPRDEKLRISGSAERELKAAGILEDGQWYAFVLPEDPNEHSQVLALMEKYPQRFVRGKTAAALTIKNLSVLTPEEKQIIRFRDITLITRTVLMILSILGGIFVFTFIQTWTSSLVAQKVMKDIRLELFKKTGTQSTAFLSRHPVGRIVTRLTGDVETINEFFTNVLIAFLKDFSVMAGSLITLFILSPRLAGVVLLTLPPVLVLTAFSRVRARDAFRQQRIASSKVNAYLSERLSGIPVVQLFLGERRSQREFGERNGEYLKANMAEMYVYATFRPIIDFLSTLTTAAVIAVGANFVLNLSLSLGVLIAFINLVGLFYAPVMDIAEKYTLLQSAMAGGERVFALLDTDEKIPDTGSKQIEGMLRGHVEFSHVTFAYKEGEEVLKDLSFIVKPGEMAAIVGYTGAGKTTITNVLARLWDIQGGTIKLDGIPIEEIPLPELRRSVLPVLQEVFLFSGTVAENISLGLSLERDAIVEAARAVHADEFISRLPQGYDTILSEGAANISSGQRQLLSFARVIAHNPAMVILDEATSSIDTETERLIQLGIERVLSDRTSIVIAHRLSTIRHADRILVLSGGALIEEGRHEELIAKNGLYAGLYRLQFSETAG
ncbi:MAG: ABC transporter ATP-binding protein/permease [Treponema sp.]|nr:ABC transporter ATP-binding protein/permease [Treponema sp.]